VARPIPTDLSENRGGQFFSADPERLKANLVRLGKLDIRDFLLLDTPALLRVAAEVQLAPDLTLAFNNVPDVWRHLRVSISDFRLPGETRDCPGLRRSTPGSVPAGAPPNTDKPPLHDIESAQSRLTHLFALDLLKTKAPPLYDSLPWHDWDFSIVARRFKLWQTRFLLAGDGSTTTMCNCRKSAGVFVLEPHEPTARYIKAKAELEKVKRFRLLPCSLDHSIPLSPSSVDLAIIASSPSLQPANCELQTAELARVAKNVLLIENSPLSPPLDPEPLLADGFAQATVQVRAIGPRPCWWRAQK
jgi:hypothetical protein